MELLLYLSYIFIIILTYLSTIYPYAKLRKCPPTAFLCIPVVGHLYLDYDPIAECFAKLANRYGPIFFLWTGWRPTVVVSSPDVLEECLTHQNDVVFANRPSRTFLGKYRGYDYKTLNFAPYGPHWKNLRKIVTVEVLSSHRLQSFADIRAEEVRLLVKRLCKYSDNKVAEMRPQIFDKALNIMVRVIFGESYCYGSEEFMRIREFVVESIALANLPCVEDVVPYLRWLDRTSHKRFRKYTEKRDELMKELVEEHRGKSKENVDAKVVKVKPVIQTLLELQQTDPDYYTDQVIHSLIVECTLFLLEYKIYHIPPSD